MTARAAIIENCGATACKSPEKQYRLWEQACRERWRSLALCIKAKMETVRSGISSFEIEFLPHFVVGPKGRTIADEIVPQLEQSVKNGRMPSLQLMS
jgi:hypothetical protein